MTDDAVAWALGQLGPGARVVGRRSGEEAELWHLRGAEGDAWLKRHRHAAKAVREAAVLKTLAPHLADAIPAVLGVGEPGAILLSSCPGAPVDLAALDPSARVGVLQRAGALLRRLSSVPLDECDPDPLPLSDAYARRIETWTARAEATLPAERLDALRRELDPGVFRGASRTLCHRDFRPDNWILGDDSALFVIDFGQARPDDWLVDLAKLDPGDVAHVLVGFGRALDPSEQARLHVLRALHELATLTWAHPRSRTPGRSR